MLGAMSLKLHARDLRDLLADPAAAEGISAATGTPLLIVQAGDAAAGRSLAHLDITGVPAVVLVIPRDPRSLPPAAFSAAGGVPTEGTAALPPLVRVADGSARPVAELSA